MDEQVIPNSIRSMRPEKFDFNPHREDALGRGTLQIYITAATIKIASLLNAVKVSSDFNYYKSYPGELNKLYLAGRYTVLIMGIISVFLVYLLGKMAFNENVGLLASFILGVFPGHVVNSHFLTLDVPVGLWSIVVFIFSYLLMKQGKNLYFLAGIAVGLTIATKYSHPLIILVPIVAHIMKNKFKNLSLIIYIFAGTFAGFFIGNPYSVLAFSEFKNFTTNLFYGLATAPEGDVFWSGTPAYLFQIFVVPYYIMGLPLQILLYISIAWALIKREKIDILILIWIVIYMFTLISVKWRFTRWAVSLMPFAGILIARFVYDFLKYINNKKQLKIIYLFTIGLSLFYTLLYSYAYVKLMSGKVTQESSSEWIKEHIPPGSSIGVLTPPFYGEPSLVTSYYWYKSDKIIFRNKPEYEIIPLDRFPKTKPKYIVLNYRNFKEDIILSGYNEIKTFSSVSKLSFWEFPFKHAPMDWRRISPPIKIFERET
jgi:hypothetical protein